MDLMQIVTCSVMLIVIFGGAVDARSMKMFQANKEVSKAGNQIFLVSDVTSNECIAGNG